MGFLNDKKWKKEKEFIDSTFYRKGYSREEYEANEFAASILMPEDKLDFLIYKKDITSIKKLAKIMRVSEAAMLYRLRGLGWIKWEIMAILWDNISNLQ